MKKLFVVVGGGFVRRSFLICRIDEGRISSGTSKNVLKLSILCSRNEGAGEKRTLPFPLTPFASYRDPIVSNQGPSLEKQLRGTIEADCLYHDKPNGT